MFLQTDSIINISFVTDMIDIVVATPGTYAVLIKKIQTIFSSF